MLFSALSLKVLVGLGTLVGVSFLSIHYTSKDTNTNTLNSKQGGEVVMPEQKEILDKAIQREESRANWAANKKAKKENADSKIATIKSEIEKLKQEITECDKKYINAKNYYDVLNAKYIRDQYKPDKWTGNQDEWNNNKRDARELRDKSLVKQNTANTNLKLKEGSLMSKEKELTEAKVARNKLNW